MLLDPTFPDTISKAWRHSNRLVEAIERFTKDVLVWDKIHFGNIFAKKKNLMAMINSIQREIALKSSSFLLNMENELLRELDSILN